jgi:desulfoferrodoxin (superoxide reductase-like protein)
LNEKQKDVGNMKRMMFYQCKQCKNILTSTSPADITCCGRKLSPLIPQGMDSDHNIRLTEMDNELYAEIDHAMSKEHYISFIAQLTGDKLFLAKLYPEQDAAMRNSKTFVHCSEHGLSVK